MSDHRLRIDRPLVVGSEVERALQLLGWPGVALPGSELFGCRVIPVVELYPDVHRARLATGYGPQLDSDTLTMWEWPESADRAPAPALRLSGALFVAGRRWWSALADAARWRGFGSTAVLARQPVGESSWLVDEVVLTEFDLDGVGLVSVVPDEDGSEATAGCSARLAVPAEPGRRPPARRSRADRWLEEVLYRRALDNGCYPPATPAASA